MKNTNQSIDKAIIDMIRETETRHSIRLTKNIDGDETCILQDDECGDITIFQTYTGKVTTTILDNDEIEALKAILL